MSIEGLVQRIKKRTTENIAKELMKKLDVLIKTQEQTNRLLEEVVKLLERGSE